MLKDRSAPLLLAIALFAAPAWSQGPGLQPLVARPATTGPKRSSEAMSSPLAAERFREIACQIAHLPDVSGAQADQAIILLTAAKSLNREIDNDVPLLLTLATRHAEKDYSEQIILWLQRYVDQSADRAVIRDAIQYLLDRLNVREERQRLLEELVTKIGNRNPAVDSDLAMLLGFLMLEKADFEAAKFYLVQAYTNNKYNKVALTKLAELAPDEIGPATYLEHLRLVVRENPLDLDAALKFAQYAERLQLYDLAALSYQYCAELFRYLYPPEPLAPHIYLPWAISSYNTQRSQHVALHIAQSIRNQGRFDILLEAIAGRAAAKTGNPGEAQRIFRQAEREAEQLLQSGPPLPGPPAQGVMTPVRTLTPKQFAWFYCFADPNPQRALDWANRAYSVEPNAPSAAALLAYALSLNGQLEWARPLLQSSEGSQIADLVQAQVWLADDKRADAIQILKIGIAKDPGSLAAERAKEMLRDLGGEYAAPVDGGTVMAYLNESLNKAVTPKFLPPDKILQIQFNTRGSEFAYGAEIEAIVAVANQAAEPLVVTEDGLFQGRIRVDAKVSGDLNEQIASLVTQTVRTDLLVAPGRSLTIPLRLSCGRLAEMLRTYPQASVQIEFVLYVDPVVADDGAVANRLVDLKPVSVSVKRAGIELTGSYVRNRFNSISSGQEGQKIQTAELFTGLLKEQYAMAEHGTLYPFKYNEWLPNLLRSALTSQSGLLLGGGEAGWVVRVNTMADMLGLPLDLELASVVARNLGHPNWAVRMMALYLLAQSTGENFTAVLDSIAGYDSDGLVRSMAIALRSGRSAAGGTSSVTAADASAFRLP